jgi:hypothetical protein
MSNAALTPRSSALVSIPTRTELEALGPADLWMLEERAGEVQDAAREINDGRLRHWIEVEGKTQTEVAQMVGRSTTRISERCARLGIEPPKGKGTAGGRPRKVSGTGNFAPDDAEEVDAEIVEDVSGERPPSRPAASGLAYAEPDLQQGASDPGPRVKCPTCGHMVVPSDIHTWKE